MSYCRWSSDRFQCDLYCYADASGGYTTHVAGSRRKPIADEIADPYDLVTLKLFEGNPDAWKAAAKIWREALDAAEIVNIDSPHAGKTYRDPDLESFRDRIIELSKDPALNVPTWLLPIIEDEIAEEKMAS